MRKIINFQRQTSLKLWKYLINFYEYIIYKDLFLNINNFYFCLENLKIFKDSILNSIN